MSLKGYPRDKLTFVQAKAIRDSPTLPLSVLATLYGVSKSRISLIKRGLVWKEGK